MKNTIEINGKTYRCRDENINPLAVYLNCNSSNMYPHSLRYYTESKTMHMIFLNQNFRIFDCLDAPGKYDLIEVKNEQDQIKELLENGKRVLCKTSYYKDFNPSQIALIVAFDKHNDDYVSDEGHYYSFVKPLTQEEINKYSFNNLTTRRIK